MLPTKKRADIESAPTAYITSPNVIEIQCFTAKSNIIKTKNKNNKNNT